MLCSSRVYLWTGQRTCSAICWKPYSPVAEEEIDSGGDWFLDLECQLVELFHWSLYQIDETDIESLLPFVFYYPQWRARATEKKTGEKKKEVFADQVNWL